MQDSQLATISNFIWNIADSVLRDLFVRGKYRDVILPMTVIRRLDAVLEPTKQKVLAEKKWLDEEKIADQTGPLQQRGKSDPDCQGRQGDNEVRQRPVG